MKRGCLVSIICVIAGLLSFALLAPLIFHDADKRALGRNSFPVIVIVFGVAGYFIGRSKKNMDGKGSVKTY
jgi:hypothetical protein